VTSFLSPAQVRLTYQTKFMTIEKLSMFFTGTFSGHLLFEMVLFAVFALGLEVVFTSVCDWKNDKRRFLMGYSSLWYVPLYALAPVFLHLTSAFLFELPFLLRGTIYALVIFALEYLGMLSLRLLLGASPSQEHYYKARWNVHGLIRLDYFPVMWLMGLVFEWVFRMTH